MTITDFAATADQCVKAKESKMLEKYLDFARDLLEHEGDGGTNHRLFAGNCFQRLFFKRQEEFDTRGTI